MTIGLVLSGGGARGIAHLGTLKALEELDLRPSMISGVSAGAIVGALYGAGMSPSEILELLTTTKLVRHFGLGNLKGLMMMEKTEAIYKKHISENTFESLSMPLFVGATNLTQGETVFFSSGELIRPLQASSAIPVLFSPVEINGDLYADGGILNNLPVEPLADKCEVIIGSHPNALDPKMPIKNIKQVLERTAYLAITTNTVARRERCDLYLEAPEMAKYTVLDLKSAREIYRVGYEYTLKEGRKFIDQRFEQGHRAASI